MRKSNKARFAKTKEAITLQQFLYQTQKFPSNESEEVEETAFYAVLGDKTYKVESLRVSKGQLVHKNREEPKQSLGATLRDLIEIDHTNRKRLLGLLAGISTPINQHYQDNATGVNYTIKSRTLKHTNLNITGFQWTPYYNPKKLRYSVVTFEVTLLLKE